MATKTQLNLHFNSLATHNLPHFSEMNIEILIISSQISHLFQMSSNFTSHFNYITIIFLLIFCEGCLGTTFTLTNRCDYTVWPGVLANAGSDKLDSTGFELPSGGTRSFQAPPGWSGRFWGRTRCKFDPITGQGSCSTGDCGSNQVECNGSGAAPPATLAEFTIGSGSAQDFYDVSLVDGYYLPMIVQAKDGTGPCGSTGCITDLNRMCPNELRVIDGQACKSACEAFGNPEYCCSGAYGSPTTCRPSVYSDIFKTACPRSYSYAYDDATSTFTCSGADYTITFCSSLTSQKSSRNSSSPEIATGTTKEPPVVIVNGSGSDSQDNNLPSWLPNYVTGDSSRTIPSFALRFSLFVTYFVLFFIYYI